MNSETTIQDFIITIIFFIIVYLILKQRKKKREQQNENNVQKKYSITNNNLEEIRKTNDLVKSKEFERILKNLEAKQAKKEEIQPSNYYKKNKLLTANEKLFYKVLKEAVKEKEIIIQTQVVLYEIVNVKNNAFFYSNFNKIKSKSIDFVLVDYNFNILVCIELDDYTHNRHDRIQRDEFINQLFRETNIRLIRVQAQPYYNVDRIRELIEECL